MEIATNDVLLKARLLVRGLWARRWTAVAVAGSVALVCALLVSLVPDRYEANARVYVDTQTVLKPLMVGLTYQPDIDQQVRMLARTLVSRPNVERLLDTPSIGLGPVGSAKAREKELNRLMERIKVVSAGAGNLYAISYRDSDPARAQRLVEGIVELFMKSSSGEKKRDSLEAGRFIDEQIRAHETKLADAENRLKEFKLRNFAVAGVSNQDYFARMSALSDEVNRQQVELQAAERSRDALRRELTAEEQYLPVDVPAGLAPAVLPEVDARLQAQKKQLDELLRRFTDEHPDVITTRRVIAEIEQQKRQDADERARAGEGRTRGTAATNPVYQRLRVALAEKEAQVAALRSQLGASQARLQEIRSVASRMPQVEADLAQLNRDYDIIRKNYDQLVARRESATLGVKLDESSQLADFRVVEPPRVSRYPVFPGRIHLAALAGLLAVVVGLAAAVAWNLVRPTFDAARTLREVTQRPVLGTVSMLVTDPLRASERIDRIRLALVAAALLVLQTGWLAWIAVRGPLP
jgi:polysaccharide chain length determinant protein (PEP-CTERM system associated)